MHTGIFSPNKELGNHEPEGRTSKFSSSSGSVSGSGSGEATPSEAPVSSAQDEVEPSPPCTPAGWWQGDTSSCRWRVAGFSKLGPSSRCEEQKWCQAWAEGFGLGSGQREGERRAGLRGGMLRKGTYPGKGPRDLEGEETCPFPRTTGLSADQKDMDFPFCFIPPTSSQHCRLCCCLRTGLRAGVGGRASASPCLAFSAPSCHRAGSLSHWSWLKHHTLRGHS